MRIVLALGLCLVAMAAVAAPRGETDTKSDAQAAENYRVRMNENVVTIMAGSPNGTDLGIAYDIAKVVDDGDNLRVLPIVGQGAAQSVKDVMFLKGVDMGITQANIIKYFARTGELGSNFVDRIVYVAKLFTEEVHIIVRSDVTDIKQLNGKRVNFGEQGSGTDITARLVLDALGVKVQELHLADADAIEKLKSGEITAVIVRLDHPVEDCQPLAIPENGAMLQEGDRVFEATAKQDGMLSQWSGREPVSQIGTIRRVFPSGPDGSLAYFADLSGGEGGSGGGVFRVVSGQLSL